MYLSSLAIEYRHTCIPYFLYNISISHVLYQYNTNISTIHKHIDYWYRYMLQPKQNSPGKTNKTDAWLQVAYTAPRRPHKELPFARNSGEISSRYQLTRPSPHKFNLSWLMNLMCVYIRSILQCFVLILSLFWIHVRYVTIGVSNLIDDVFDLGKWMVRCKIKKMSPILLTFF